MADVISITLVGLIEKGNRDPGKVTDLLLEAGYNRAMTTEEWVKATAEAGRTWRSLGLPCGDEPETPEDVMGCYLNEIVDTALDAEGVTAHSVAAAVIRAGFRLEMTA